MDIFEKTQIFYFIMYFLLKTKLINNHIMICYLMYLTIYLFIL